MKHPAFATVTLPHFFPSLPMKLPGVVRTSLLLLVLGAGACAPVKQIVGPGPQPGLRVADAHRIIARHDSLPLTSLYAEDAELLTPDSAVVRGRAAIEAYLTGKGEHSVFRVYHPTDVRITTRQVYVCGDRAVQVGDFSARLVSEGRADQPWYGQYAAVWSPDESGSWRIQRSVFTPPTTERRAFGRNCLDLAEDILLHRTWALSVTPPLGLRSGGPIVGARAEMQFLEWSALPPDCRGAGCERIRLGVTQSPFTVTLRNQLRPPFGVELSVGRTQPVELTGRPRDPPTEASLTYSANQVAVLGGVQLLFFRVFAGPEVVWSSWTWSDPSERQRVSSSDASLGVLAAAGSTVALNSRVFLELNAQRRLLGHSTVPAYREFPSLDVEMASTFVGMGVGFRF